MTRGGRTPRAIATLALALLVAVVGTPAVAAPEADPDQRVGHWSALVRSHPQLMATAVEARAASAAADRRAADGARDVVWVGGAVEGARSRLAAAADERDRATEARVAIARRLARARMQLEELGHRMDTHAATIYKHGMPALGPIESLLRSGSPGDYMLRQRMSEAVLLEDDTAFRRAAGIVDQLDADHRRALAQASVARAAWRAVRGEAIRLEGLVGTMRSQQRSAERAAGAARAELIGARAAESSSLAAIVAVEAEVGETDGARQDVLAAQRSGSLERARVELAERYPFVDGPRGRTPSSWPPVGGYRCPVEGGRFTNDWAFPRQGGRSHEGTDVFASAGTPVLAVTAGRVVRIDQHDTYQPGEVAGDLGGVTISVETSSGERWYYAHLDELAEGLDVGVEVAAGRIVGTLGDSGNARGGEPHLHLGRYWQELPINPYPSLAIACG